MDIENIPGVDANTTEPPSEPYEIETKKKILI